MIRLLDRFRSEFGPDYLKREIASWPWFAVPMALLWAIALAGTGLSPSAEPVPVSSASPLPSLSQGLRIAPLGAAAQLAASQRNTTQGPNHVQH